jgi:hypothetical protein
MLYEWTNIDHREQNEKAEREEEIWMWSGHDDKVQEGKELLKNTQIWQKLLREAVTQNGRFANYPIRH